MRIALIAVAALAWSGCPAPHPLDGSSSTAGSGAAGGSSGGQASASGGTTGSAGATTGASSGGCPQGQACTPANVCDNGSVDCATGAAVCKDQGTANLAQTGVSCGPLATCQGTTCLTANWPLMPNNGGGVLATPNLVLINYSDDTNARNLQHDAAWVVVDGGFLSLIGSPYGVGSGSSQIVGLGESTTAPTGTNTNPNAFPTYFQSLFDAGTIPPYAPNNLYVLYLPSSWPDTGVFCESAGGYHTVFQDNNGDNVPYAIIPNCLGDSQGYLQELEFAATHEIVEGATDPALDGWIFQDPNSPSSYLGGEVADMCESFDIFYTSASTSFVAPFIWSNSAIAAGQVPCQPWPAGIAYVSVLAPPTMALALPGSAAKVTVTGWASAPTASWGVQAMDDPVGYADYGTLPSLSDHTLSPGEQVTVTLNVPSSAMGGQHGAVWIKCVDASSQQGLGAAMVGVTAGCVESYGCGDPQTVCDLDGGSIGSCGENPCAGSAAPFSICSAQGTDDGVCLPNDFGNGPVELCNQSGSLPTGSANCLGSRSGDGGVAGYCSSSSYCFGINTPTCLDLCDPNGGAPSCATGDDCVGIDQYFGVCSPDCTTGQTCPTGESCYGLGNGQSGCLP